MIERNWWPEDGSKLDFAGALAVAGDSASAPRRWGQATRLLEEQSGHIDGAFLRRVLADHYEGSHDEIDPLDAIGPQALCSHLGRSRPLATVSSLIANLGGTMPLVWWAYGPPCGSVYLPLLPAGQLPSALADDMDVRLVQLASADPMSAYESDRLLEGLQALLDAETAEFLADVVSCDDPERQTTLFMQHVWEEVAEVADGLLGRCRVSVNDEPLSVF